jgi:hypothetical protein
MCHLVIYEVTFFETNNPTPPTMKSGLTLIGEERDRHSGQRYNHSADDDAKLGDGELARKAVEKISSADQLGDPQAYGRALVVAGSLIAAEIDRLVRKHGGISIPAHYGEVTEPTNDGRPEGNPGPTNDGNPGPGAGPTNDAPPGGASTTTEEEDEEEEIEEPGTETAKQLEENNRHEDLVQLAADEEVEINPRDNKTTIAKAIVKARKKKAKANQ